MAHEQLTKRALLLTILRRLDIMATDITALKSAIASLQSSVAAIDPVLAASADLNLRVIAELDSLAAQIAALQPDAQQIADLAASVGATVSALQADAQKVTDGNASLQAELDKVAAPSP